MTSWRDDKPRPHHYQFAHRALPAIALKPSVDLAALADEGRLDAALRATWAAVGERQEPADRLTDEGLRARMVSIAGAQGVLVTLPAAAHATEAFFAVIAPVDGQVPRRYILLEFSWNVVAGEPATVLGEWRSGSHFNLGGGPRAVESEFLAQVEEIFRLSAR
jgi:hypothetical protein